MELSEEPFYYSKGTLLRSKVLGLCRIKYIYKDIGKVGVIFNYRPYGATADAHLRYVDGKIYELDARWGGEVEIVEN